MSKVNPTDGATAKPARSKKARANSLRLMHLLFLLQSTNQPLTRDQILDLVEGYPEDDAAAQRMFERDKATLRDEIGVSLETRPTEDDVEGYRIVGSDHLMAPIEFSPAERTLLSLAVRAWDEQQADGSAQHALGKLSAMGVELDPATSAAIHPRVASVPGLDVFWEAVHHKAPVTFDYRSSRGVGRRVVEPWLLVERGGAWYLVGHDRTRDERRTFKLTRVQGQPTMGTPRSFTVPDHFDREEALGSLEPSRTAQSATIAVRGDYAPALRRRGQPVSHPATPQGYQALRVESGTDDLVLELAGCGADALVLEPADLREQVIAHLRAVVTAHGGHSTPVTEQEVPQ